MKLNSQAKPLFLSGLWESGINTLWPYIRERENTLCYYEPLHPYFSKITRNWVGKDTSAMKIMGSAPITTPDKSLYAEFIPFIGGGLYRRGVVGFRKKFSHENIVMREGDQNNELRLYFQQFINTAHKQHRIPVFAEHRFIYRLGWVNHNFGGTSIHVTRDPYAIWSIYQNKHMQGYHRFFIKWFRIFERNKNKWLGHLSKPLKLRRGMDQYLIYDESFYADVLKHMTKAETYRLVFGVWLKALYEGLYNADMVVDLDNATKSSYADRISMKIKELTDLDLDLSTLENKAYAQAEHNFEPRKIEELIATEFGTYLKHQNKGEAKILLNSDLSHLSEKSQRCLKIVASVFD